MGLLDQYSEKALRAIVNRNYSYKSCMKDLGYRAMSGDSLRIFKNKLKEYNIDVSHFKYQHHPKLTKEEIFKENSKVSQKALRKYFKEEDVPYVCAICGQEPFWNGAPMTLILDHINGYNNDNRKENLRWVCPNCNIQLDTTNGKNINHKIRIKYHCIDCGKEINKDGKRCKKCADKMKEKDLPLTKEELKEKIKTTSFTQIGKENNVSDNAVRKWCKKYGLPYRKKDIKQMS